MSLSAPTYISFTPGTLIHAADTNSNNTASDTAFTAIINALTGVVAQQFTFLSTANNAIALTGQLPTAPGADQDVIGANVLADSVNRISFYVRSSDGYGGIRAGLGSSVACHLFAQAGLWMTTEQFWIQETIGTGNKLYLRFDSTDRKSWGIAYNKFTDGMYWYNYTDSHFGPEIGPSGGQMYVGTGTATVGNFYAQLTSGGGGAAGQKVWVGTTDPGGAAVEGDIWLNG